MNQIVALILDEGKWLTGSMLGAVLVVLFCLFRFRHSGSAKNMVMGSMNLFFGMTIGSMAFGHLLAITTKLLLGTLKGSLLFFYGIGVVLAIPSWWLILYSFRMLKGSIAVDRTVLLNSWLGLTLVILGITNLPLAAPSILNIAYHFHSKRVAGWAIVTVAIVFNLGLFIGSLIFLASGQSFEQFSGIE